VFDAVVLNGTGGSGKTTTAEALAALLVRHGVPRAVVDIDAVRQLWPSPPDDPFQQSIAVANVSAVARNYREAGASRLVLAGVVESMEDLDGLRQAVAPWELAVCRSVVDPEVAAHRLRSRHAPDVVDWSLEWHLNRSPVLARILDGVAVDDWTVDVTDDSRAQVAEQVATYLGW
jgi:adenylylsulfate kinase